ncbi:hypothetical protein GCM10010464_31570 [Pseudonocardia yunnanensis]
MPVDERDTLLEVVERRALRVMRDGAVGHWTSEVGRAAGRQLLPSPSVPARLPGA